MTYHAKVRPDGYRAAAARGLTQAETAEVLGVSPTAVSRAKARQGLTFVPGKGGQKVTPKIDTPKLIAAYKRIEDEAGGIGEADLPVCVTRAAAECGVAYPEALDALRRYWAGYRG